MCHNISGFWWVLIKKTKNMFYNIILSAELTDGRYKFAEIFL